MARTDADAKTTSTSATWLKRFGLAGFLFFFIKGLAWIGVAAAASLGIATL